MQELVLYALDTATNCVKVFTANVDSDPNVYFNAADKQHRLISVTLTEGTFTTTLSIPRIRVVDVGDTLSPSDIDKELTNLNQPAPARPTTSTMTALDKVVVWNARRNLTTFDLAAELRMLNEELQELVGATTDHQQVDALCDIIVLATGAIHKLGYNPEQSMLETLREINSRQGTINPATGKWQKDPNQDPSTLYTADYSLTRY